MNTRFITEHQTKRRAYDRLIKTRWEENEWSAEEMPNISWVYAPCKLA